LLGCYSPYQLGYLGSELNRKVFEPCGATKQADPGDYLSYGGLADFGIVIV
jgi:hypothetical protein